MSQPGDDRLLEHSYDGIQEYDNPLPRWWLLTFYASIVFSIGYWIFFHMGGPGLSPDEAYAKDMAAFREKTAALTAESGPSEEALAALLGDPAALAEGKASYDTVCAACHRPDGGGLIGPNLTDDHWIHGRSLMEIHKVIEEGVLAKGMPAWGKQLKPGQVNAVTAYVASLYGTNPAGAKAAEGETLGAPGNP